MMSIYKYMPVFTPDKEVNLLKYIFEDKTLRFSSPLIFNDPFELRPHIKKMVSTDNNIVHKLVFSHLNTTKQAHKFHDTTVTKLSNDIGILCLSGIKDHLVMWGNYADNHKGIVIEFDKEHSFFSPDCKRLNFIHQLKKVVYLEQKISMNSDEWEENERTFLAKSKHWEFEEEYRMTVLLEENDRNPNRFNLEFPSNLIKSVYIGCKAKNETIEYIKNLKVQEQWKHLNIYNMMIDEREYKLNPIKL